MPEYDNPAGRLHALLSRYCERQSSPILNAWAYALEVEPDDVIRSLAIPADLVEETRRAAIDTNEASYRDMPAHLDTLAVIVSPTKHAIASTGANNALPDAITMAKLAMLSAHLSQHMPDANLPGDDEVNALREEVNDLIAAIGKSDLPPEVKSLLIKRLAEVLQALDQLHRRGPDAVRLAAEALLGTANVYGPAGKNGAMFNRMRIVARVAWVLVTVGGPIGTNAIGWEQLDHQLTEPAAHAEQRALPRGGDRAQP